MSTSRQGFGSMDCIRSDRMQSWKANTFFSHVGMLLLLSFAMCIPGAVGFGLERHFQLRSRRLIVAPPLLTPSPPPDGSAVPMPSPSPSPPPRPPPHPVFVPHPPAYPPVPRPPSFPPPLLSPPPPSPPPPLVAARPSMAPPPLVAPHPISPPSLPPVPLPPPILPSAPTPVPRPSPPLESPAPSAIPPVKPSLSPPPSTMVSPGSTWNESEKAGVLIAAIAALLQVAVVAFLLIKRHQMLTTVEYEDMDDDSDPDYRHPEGSA